MYPNRSSSLVPYVNPNNSNTLESNEQNPHELYYDEQDMADELESGDFDENAAYDFEEFETGFFDENNNWIEYIEDEDGYWGYIDNSGNFIYLDDNEDYDEHYDDDNDDVNNYDGKEEIWNNRLSLSVSHYNSTKPGLSPHDHPSLFLSIFRIILSDFYHL